MNTTDITVDIPADVRDNSETVTDYAFMRQYSPVRLIHTVQARESALKWATTFGHTVYQWDDVNPDGQRCRFHLITRHDVHVVHLFHTEYFTRVACAECAYSYASVYQVIQTEDGMSEAVPRCGGHAHRFRRAVAGTPGLVLRESERLRIGQHD